MSDPLSQLLHHTDQQLQPPTLNSTALPARVRRSEEKQFQRRATTGLLATIPILAYVVLLAIHHPRQPQDSVVRAVSPSSENLAMQIAYHQRIADILEANPPLSTANPHATDDFLFHLQLERSKAALVLLNSATDQLRDGQNNTQATDRFHQTIALFPETPAAVIAQQRIEQLENSKRQS